MTVLAHRCDLICQAERHDPTEVDSNVVLVCTDHTFVCSTGPPRVRRWARGRSRRHIVRCPPRDLAGGPVPYMARLRHADCVEQVRVREQSGNHMLVLSSSQIDNYRRTAPVVRRAAPAALRGVAGRPTRASACETMVLDCQAVGTTSAENPTNKTNRIATPRISRKPILVMCSSFC
jgi:hypothetical protein